MKLTLIYKGGPGSGFAGHAGIPGHQGGSAPETGLQEEAFSQRDVNGIIKAQSDEYDEVKAKMSMRFSKSVIRSGILRGVHNGKRGGFISTQAPRNDLGNALREIGFVNKGRNTTKFYGKSGLIVNIPKTGGRVYNIDLEFDA
jgi:hypothetical protein